MDTAFRTSRTDTEGMLKGMGYVRQYQAVLTLSRKFAANDVQYELAAKHAVRLLSQTIHKETIAALQEIRTHAFAFDIENIVKEVDKLEAKLV